MAAEKKSRRQGNDGDVVSQGANTTNGAAVAPAKDSGDDIPHENIFLLWPNIIGMLHCSAPQTGASQRNFGQP